MASYEKFDSFIEAINEKEHNMASDALTLFLTTAANEPAASVTGLGGVTEISYTNVVTSGAGSRVLTQASSAQTSGVYKLVVNDVTITATGGAIATFRIIGIYNNTHASDGVVCKFDYGASLDLAENDSLTVDFDGTNGLYTMGA